MLLIMAAISIVVSAGIINATIWDLGAGWFSDEAQDDQYLEQSGLTNAFGYEMRGTFLADAKLPRTEISIRASDQPSPVAPHTETISSQNKIPTLLLLANGIIGLVGFWRRVSK